MAQISAADRAIHGDVLVVSLTSSTRKLRYKFKSNRECIILYTDFPFQNSLITLPCDTAMLNKPIGKPIHNVVVVKG
jgi:hypothetical protein